MPTANLITVDEAEAAVNIDWDRIERLQQLELEQEAVDHSGDDDAIYDWWREHWMELESLQTYAENLGIVSLPVAEVA